MEDSLDDLLQQSVACIKRRAAAGCGYSAEKR